MTVFSTRVLGRHSNVHLAHLACLHDRIIMHTICIYVLLQAPRHTRYDSCPDITCKMQIHFRRQRGKCRNVVRQKEGAMRQRLCSQVTSRLSRLPPHLTLNNPLTPIIHPIYVQPCTNSIRMNIYTTIYVEYVVVVDVSSRICSTFRTRYANIVRSAMRSPIRHCVHCVSAFRRQCAREILCSTCWRMANIYSIIFHRERPEGGWVT